jgi:hypothetical protein
MTTRRLAFAPLLVAAAALLSVSVRDAACREMPFSDDAILEDGGPVVGYGSPVHLAPPWHASVHPAAPCGPTCPPPTLFHADAWGQLFGRRVIHPHAVVAPSCFPRLHGWWAQGLMPSPVPPALPRCHQCGAMIEGGF